jgi:hypothetical protein
MNAETLITRFDDKPFRFVFKTLVRTVSENEGQDLCLKYRQENIDKTLPGHALEVDLRPAFERPLAEVQPKFASVPWEPSHLTQS